MRSALWRGQGHIYLQVSWYISVPHIEDTSGAPSAAQGPSLAWSWPPRAVGQAGLGCPCCSPHWPGLAWLRLLTTKAAATLGVPPEVLLCSHILTFIPKCVCLTLTWLSPRLYEKDIFELRTGERRTNDSFSHTKSRPCNAFNSEP